MTRIYIDKRYAGKNINTNLDLSFIIDDDGYLSIPSGIVKGKKGEVNNFDIATTISYFQIIYPDNQQIKDYILKVNGCKSKSKKRSNPTIP